MGSFLNAPSAALRPAKCRTMNQTMVSQAPSAALRPAKCRTIFLSMARGKFRLTTSNALVPALVPPLVPALVPALVPPQCRLSAATRDALVPP